MARPRPATFDKKKIVAENRRARFDYAIEQTYEAGIALTGTEVKSLRFGEGSIAESYADVQEGEVWLINANIPNSATATGTITSQAARANCSSTTARSPRCSAPSRARA
jgi:tmRNA-binding protein